MLRDGGLRDPEFGLDDLRHLARTDLAVGEQFEDPSTDRVAEDIEGVHEGSLKGLTYISQV